MNSGARTALRAAPQWIARTPWDPRLAAARLILRTRQRWEVMVGRRELRRPFLVLATPRSGSSLLADYCNSLPGVSCGKEMLNPYSPFGIRDRFIAKRAVIGHVVRSLRWQNADRCGAKVMLSQLESHGISIEDLRRALPGVRFLVIYRRNVAAQVVSHRRARLTRQWASQDPLTVEQVRVRLGRQETLDEYEQLRGLYARLLSQPGLTQDALLVSYEELVADPQRVFDRGICPHFGWPIARVHTRLVKLGPESLEDAVANYAEIADVLGGESACQRLSL